MSDSVLGTAGAIEVAEGIVKRLQKAGAADQQAKDAAEGQALATRQGQAGELAQTAAHKKDLAFAALRSGSTFPQAAKAAGVNRSTLYRWLQSDARFRAAYNAWQQELVESSRARLLTFTEQAVEVVGKAIGYYGNEKVAMQVLRGMGILKPPARQPIDPEIVEMKIDVDRREEARQLGDKMARNMLGRLGMTPAEQRQFVREQGIEGLHRRLEQAGRKALPAPATADKETRGQGDKGMESETRRHEGVEAEARRHEGTDARREDETAEAQPATSNPTSTSSVESQPSTAFDATAALQGAEGHEGPAGLPSAANPISTQQIREMAEEMARQIHQEFDDATAGGAPHDLDEASNS